jgi:hypothetical protein
MSTGLFSQTTTIVDTSSSKTKAIIIAGKQYDTRPFHQWLWGKHYRTEWATPVAIKVVATDTIFGGLQPIKKGGGRQTRTLRLQDKNGKQYVLRSIDKRFTKALPEIFRGTFVESVANDQVAISHPYSSVTVPMLADAAKVFHTTPQIVFIPNDANLGEYQQEFANQLYLLEERPAGFQGDAANFGYAEDVDGTDKMIEEIHEDNDHRVDQQSFVRARLFDMFLSDWGRHEDQWRWAQFKENGMTIYRPIPRDRDQAYTKFDGVLVGIGKKVAELSYLQSVDYSIKDLSGFNFQARHLDRQFTNEVSLDTWTSIASELQALLTDSIIQTSIKQLPPEVFPISGELLIKYLQARRDHLVDFAKEYYTILARQVDIVATEKKERIEIVGNDPDHLTVKLFDLDHDGKPKPAPFYTRTFNASETKEVRLYGRNGNDQFVASGTAANKTTIRLIGGPKRDSFDIPSSFNSPVKIYDDHENVFRTAGKTRLKLSDDSAVHLFNYAAYKDDKNGIQPVASYSNEDRLYVGLGYVIEKQQWRKEPYGYRHVLSANYSITQNALSFQYSGTFTEAIGKWSLGLLANYDAVRDQHFPGIGNNTVLFSTVKDYWRYRDKEFNTHVSLFRQMGHHRVTIAGFYQSITLLSDADRFLIINHAPTNPKAFNSAGFAGARAEYKFDDINDKLFPSKGISFITRADYTQNVSDAERSVIHLNGIFGFYLPLAHNLTLAVRTGAGTLTGEPEFYQLNKIGGGSTLRGFLRYRFYGKTMFYNQNELQYNVNIKTYIFAGKIGVLALLDDGRVWHPGEISNKWHMGVGGGLMIAPFNKFSVTGTMTRSNEDTRFNVRVGRLLSL